MKTLVPSFFRPFSLWKQLIMLACGTLGFAGLGQAQGFAWQTTPQFPLGSKIGLAASGDSSLVTSVLGGVLRTGNRGRTWSLTLRTHQVYALFSTRSGQLLVGGLGKIYRSQNAGATWDSVALATPYPVVSFTESVQGGLFAGTGVATLSGALGDGVFYSADNGQTWTARNAGFGSGRFVNQLAADRSGRVFAAATDEEVGRQPGLYASADQGLNWQFLPIRINGRQSIPDELTAYEVTSLAVSPQDSLLCSFSGAAGPVAVQISLAKSLNDLGNPAQWWSVQPGNGGSMWWYNSLLFRLHIARNGDWYASRTGSSNSGGTLRSINRGRSWSLERAGLGLSVHGFREAQQFAEMPDGELFMVQELDEQVYRTRASVITAAAPTRRAQFLVYPNPTSDVLRLDNRTGQAIVGISLTDMRGQTVRTFAGPFGPSSFLDIQAERLGVYFLTVKLAQGEDLRQKIVKY
ncbi:T9SS type A sorting domain-containing protein [Hymenobacter koreensis]